MNDNQNAYVQTRGKSTSRVLNEPGGASSLTLGMAPPIPGMGPPVQPTKKKAAAPPPKKEEEEKAKEPEKTVSPTSATEPPTAKTPGKTVSANAFASGANANGAQVMTGRPTSKVLHPGGGGGPTQWSLGG